ncbi:MAG: ATPase [Propionibacteriaceae bacterium]|jgi:sugar (pentulose or hexulose) kinase|nr:ATPase [Propionibacteriaceae bacterium]
MNINQARAAIREGRTSVGIEFGSTRIKAALIDADAQVLAWGSHDWENQFADRLWTYSVDAIWAGLQECYADLANDVRQRYGLELTTIGAIGISAMMHGYLAFDAAGELLVPFRTWRNTNTKVAAEELTELFSYNIPQRWSIAHLHQAVVDSEEHVSQVASINTLAGYVHWVLTGERVIGVGDASGMFPIDPVTKNYNSRMLSELELLLAEKGFDWRLRELLPKVLPAGAGAGALTTSGALLLDPTGKLAAGIAFCPPEGDAGTGMVATNSVARRTGNVSAGTSIFAMIVLERDLKELHTEIDMVTTPAGDAVAMVHCNNGASELNEWCSLFEEFSAAAGEKVDSQTVFSALLAKALEAKSDAGGLLAFNNLSGEPITGLEAGRPLFLRTPESNFTLANFMRAQLYAVFATLHLGMRILADEEVGLDKMFAHGGIFRTKGVAQRFLAAALGAPVSVSATAGEGGPWGMAVLASYLLANDGHLSLGEYLNTVVFAQTEFETLAPDPDDAAGFGKYMERYEAALAVEQAAIAHS